MCIRDRSCTINGTICVSEFDDEARSPVSDVSSIIDVPENPIIAITMTKAPITPPTTTLGFNITLNLVVLLNVKLT